MASTEGTLVDWTQAEVTEGFKDPRVLEIAPDGRMAVWDQGLYRWVVFDPESPDQSSLKPREVHRQAAGASRLQILLGNLTPRGFWDESNNFWSFFPETLGADRVVLRTQYGEERHQELEGPILDLVNYGDRWIVTRPGGRYEIRDPYLSDAPLQQVEDGFEGTLQEVTPQGEALVRDGRDFFRYREGQRMAEGRFSEDGRITVDGDTFYFYSEDRLVRLNQELDVEFTYRLTGVERIRDLTVRENTMYALTDRGLERAPLTQRAGGFFLSSTRVRPEVLLETVSPRGIVPDSEERFWFQMTDSEQQGVIFSEDGSIREISFLDHQEHRLLEAEDLPMGVLQSLVHEDSYWHPTGQFFHYFSPEGVVEQLDLQGNLVNMIRVNPLEDTRELFALEEPGLLGANREIILFRTTVVIPERGPREVVLVYDHEGELRRMVTLQHAVAGEGIPMMEEEKLVFDGEDGLYLLGEDRMEAYDLWGYPKGIELDVTDPLDLRRHGEDLYVLESGPRIRQLSPTGNGTFRHGSSPGEPPLSSVSRSNGEVVATSPRTNGGVLLEYDVDQRRFETLLERNSEVIQPAVSADGRTLYFWERFGDGWQLMEADRIRYRVNSLDASIPLDSKPVYLEDRDEFLIAPASESGGSWRLVKPGDEETETIYSEHPVTLLTPDRTDAWLMVVKERHGTSYSVHRAELREFSADDVEDEFQGDTPELTLEPSARLAEFAEPVRYLEDLAPERIRVTTEPAVGLTRLTEGTWNELGQLDGPVLRGDVRVLEEGDDVRRLYKRTGDQEGYLVEWDPDGANRTGGIRGGFRVSGPVNLEGVPVWIEPGGHLLELDHRGAFTASNLPSGLVTVRTFSHEHYLETDFHVSVEGNQFVRPGSRQIQYVENDLLRTGMERLRDGQHQPAEFVFTRFAETRGSGPEYRWGRLLADVVRWMEGDDSWLEETLYERPELLPPRQRWNLLKQRLREGPGDGELLDHAIRASVGGASTALKYRKQQIEGGAETSVEPPVYPPYDEVPRWWKRYD